MPPRAKQRLNTYCWRNTMKRKVLTGLAIAALSLGAVAAPASAKGSPQNTDCQRAGMNTLKELGLFQAVAKGGIEVVGVGVVNFPTVLKLHREAPELFSRGGVEVVVPGLGPVAAEWCDGL
jgi:hypothetical protein